MATTTVTGIGGIYWGGVGTVVEDADDSTPDDGSGIGELEAIPQARVLDLLDALVATVNASVFGGDLGFEVFHSFGFLRDDTGYLEPTSLKLFARPTDFGRAVADKTSEDRLYTVTLGAFKLVNKYRVSEINLYVNLMAKVANMFPENREFTIDADGLLEANEEDGTFAIVDGQFVVNENRFVPLIRQDDSTMDSSESQVLFDCRLQLGFIERARALTETT